MTLKRQVIGMAKATHIGPTVLVVTISFILSITQLSFPKSLEIAFAILAGQCVVGWTNDLIDLPRDSAAGRIKKPLVAQSVSPRQLHFGIAAALTSAILLSFLGPLRVKGGLLHMLGLASATLYNFGLKSTRISPVPYAISFGAMPWAVYSVVDKHPPTWLYVDFALVSMAFHFLNVIKDMEWDRSQSVMGLPQRVGRVCSITIAASCIVASLIVFGL